MREATGCPLRDASSPGVPFFSGTRSVRMGLRNRLLSRLLKDHAREVRQRRDSPLVGRLRVLLCSLIPSGTASGDEAARVLRLNRRTMLRGLHAEGTTYQQELDWVRYSMA